MAAPSWPVVAPGSVVAPGFLWVLVGSYQGVPPAPSWPVVAPGFLVVDPIKVFRLRPPWPPRRGLSWRLISYGSYAWVPMGSGFLCQGSYAMLLGLLALTASFDCLLLLLSHGFLGLGSELWVPMGSEFRCLGSYAWVLGSYALLACLLGLLAFIARVHCLR